jgi:hypothetical protein
MLYLLTIDNLDPVHRLPFPLSTNCRFGAEQVALGVAAQDLLGELRAHLCWPATSTGAHESDHRYSSR